MDDDDNLSEWSADGGVPLTRTTTNSDWTTDETDGGVLLTPNASSNWTTIGADTLTSIYCDNASEMSFANNDLAAIWSSVLASDTKLDVASRIGHWMALSSLQARPRTIRQHESLALPYDVGSSCSKDLPLPFCIHVEGKAGRSDNDQTIISSGCVDSASGADDVKAVLESISKP